MKIVFKWIRFEFIVILFIALFFAIMSLIKSKA